MNADRLDVVLTDGGEGGVAIGQQSQLRAVRGMDGESHGVVDGDALDVGHRLHTERGEFLGRDLPQFLNLIHVLPFRRCLAPLWRADAGALASSLTLQY